MSPNKTLRTVTDYVFPVLSGPIERQGPLTTLRATQVYGTAFSIGESWFVTAAHVVANAAQDDVLALARLADDLIWDFAPVEVAYRDDSRDVALIRAPLVGVKEYLWRRDVLPMFADVSAVGYPYGKDSDRPHIDARGFKGHVVTPTQCPRLAAMPGIYELSFSAPRGLSGAPLRAEDAVVGIVIGNRSTEMLVFAHREIITEEKEFTTERFEAMQVGIAVQSSELMALRLDEWGDETFESRLIRQNLLVDIQGA